MAVAGKLWHTLKLLIFRPGQLTLEFLRGCRVPYINPLRLYLTMSLVVFALIKWGGVELPKVTIDDWSYGISFSHAVHDPAPDQPTMATLFVNLYESQVPLAAGAALKPVTWADTGAAWLGKLNSKWAHKLKSFLSEPDATKSAVLNQGFVANLPYMLIAALPLFALYLKLIYRKSARFYGEHLVFALHTNAFAFMLVGVMICMPGSAAWVGICLHQGLPELISFRDYLQLILLIWLLAYLPLAMQRVYGGSRWSTLGRWLLLITVHLVVIALLIVGAELIAIVGHSEIGCPAAAGTAR